MKFRRMTRKDKACVDLYWMYSRGEITQPELDKRVKDFENRQFSLFKLFKRKAAT